jgi:tRNA threonylcarbamoyladenosine biosynthesis protein TsaB
LAAQVKEADIIIPMIDARRMEVYTQTFNSHLEPLNEIEAKVLDENSFSNELSNKQKVWFIGNGVRKFQDISTYKENASFDYANPSAKDMVKLANKKNKQHQYEDVAYFEPFYLKDFVAGK